MGSRTSVPGTSTPDDGTHRGAVHKSMTTNADPTKPSYYSFGEQYKYTKNLKEHPLFVKVVVGLV